jgi:hypothetical protein
MPEPPKRSSSIGMDSSRWATKTSPHTALNPAANLSQLSIHSNASTLVNQNESSQTLHPPNRQLVNSLTGEIVVPRAFEVREKGADDRWKQHNKDFMAHAKGLLSTQSQAHKLKNTPSAIFERVEEPPSPANTVHHDKPIPATSMNSNVKVDELHQNKLTSESDEANVVKILTQMKRLEITSPSQGKPTESLSTHDSANTKYVNGINHDMKVGQPGTQFHAMSDLINSKVLIDKSTMERLERLLEVAQASFTNQQTIARDIAENLNSSRKSIHETAERIHVLHDAILQHVKDLQVPLKDMKMLDQTLKATSESFIALVTNPELEDLLRNFLQNKPQVVDTAKLVCQIQDGLANTNTVNNNPPKKTAEVKQDLSKGGVDIKRGVEASSGEANPTKPDGVSKSHHESNVANGRHKESEPLEINPSIGDIDLAAVNLPQIDCKYNKAIFYYEDAHREKIRMFERSNFPICQMIALSKTS